MKENRKDRKEYMRDYHRKWLQNRRSEWILKNGPCKKCGSTEKLEVDHIDPHEKRTHLIWSRAENFRREELKKCQVLCRKCHREKTSAENSIRFKGRINKKARKHGDELILKLLRLHFDDGLSQRAAALACGVSRSLMVSILYKGERADTLEKFRSGREDMRSPVKRDQPGAVPGAGATS